MNSSTSYHVRDDIIGARVDDELKSLTLHISQPGAPCSFAEHTYFFHSPLALEKILDLGYEIVNACRKLMPQVQEHAPANEASESDVTHDFRPGAYAGPTMP